MGEDTDGHIIDLLINIPEKRLERLISVNLNARVWQIKHQIVTHICSDLEEGFNFGLFLPEHEKRLGKYMAEERCIREYRLSGSPPTVVFKYYCKSTLNNAEPDKKALQKSTKSKDYQAKFYEYICEANMEKIRRVLERGIDPNFIHKGSGHTPVTKAVIGKDAKTIIMLLCKHGAFLEFRDRSGLTPLHHAAINGAHEPMLTLLDMGASVNARDLKGLTPLYKTIMEGNSRYSCELLLKEHSEVDVVDFCEWTELHQACKRGMREIVEWLVLYGANPNAQNAAGNTPLHICASFNKLDCARMLLYRGIDKNIKNKAGQTASEVALLSGNEEVMNNIKMFSSKSVEPFTQTPSFTLRKREAVLARGGSIGSASGSVRSQTSTKSLPVSAAATIEPVEHEMSLEELYTTARTCHITKNKRGFGFHVKGLSDKTKEFKPNVKTPCAQFIFGVDKESESDKAGIRANDFIIEINGTSVETASHNEVVKLIKKSGDPLILKVVHVDTSAKAEPPPAVPRRAPTTRVVGPMGRSKTISGIRSNYRQDEQIYANTTPKPHPDVEVPLPAEEPAISKIEPDAHVAATLDKMNTVSPQDRALRSNTMPSRQSLTESEQPKEEEEEQKVIRVLPKVSPEEIHAQKKRLSVTGAGSVTVDTVHEEIKEEVEIRLPKSKSAEDIARRAEEMRKKRSSKSYNYDLPPPPTMVPPPPPPEEMPPPPEDDMPEIPLAPPPSPPPPIEHINIVIDNYKDKDDTESYDSGFIQNGKHVEDWEAQDVADWLAGLGLGEYKSTFIENDIRGPSLLQLKKDDFKELGVTKLGHRITLTNEIKTKLSEGR